MILLKQFLSVYFYINLKGSRKHHSQGSDVLRTLVDGALLFIALLTFAIGLDKIALNWVFARFVILLPLIWYFVHEEKAPPENMEAWQRELLERQSDE